MWQRTTLSYVFVIMAVLPFVFGVANNTNVTLRAACVDAYGNLCQDTSKWTVIQSDGKTLFNETSGNPQAKGISNFTFWLNETGEWYVLVNYSSQNHTAEWNIIVEDYDTQTTLGIAEELDMTGALILYGLIVLGLLYAGFTLKEDHAILKLLLVAVGIILMPVGFIIASSTMTGAASSMMVGVVIVSASLLLIVCVYAFLYFFIKLIQTMMGQGKEIEKK